MRFHFLTRLLAIVAAVFSASAVHAAGTLTVHGSPDAPIEIRDHHVEVVINNGFAQTTVTQTFYNPNPNDLEGVYAFPVPRDASLSEMSILSGEIELQGEVLARDEAERLYGEEKKAGNDAGLATKETYQRFEFRVSPLRAQSEARMRFVYYQPLEIDTSVGRYLYPLEEGGTDEIAKSFWLTNDKVERSFSIDVKLHSDHPVVDVRAPGYEAAAKITQKSEGEVHVRVDAQGGTLGRDFLLYYKLADGLPGRVEMLPYRADANEPGHFMLVVTPGMDLKPLDAGADFVFVLDHSGSMSAKLGTLVAGVRQAVGELRPEDRFRVIAFNNGAHEVVGWTHATPDAVARAMTRVEALGSSGGTNVYAGLQRALDDIDADRVTSLILVTDGVTNTGIVDPKAFHALMKSHDVRVFGFLMGNSANWPLMRTICDASGGFYAAVSNADDVLGQVLLAKSKVTHEAMHDVSLSFDGVRVFDLTGNSYRKVYRGQQLVLFGRYERGGAVDLDMTLRLSGQDRALRTRFELPEIATDHPEIERLFALAHVNELEDRVNAGVLDATEGGDAIEGLGVAYQLVTDETAMVVMSDAAFERHGIERHNRDRVATERAAQQERAQAPVRMPARFDRSDPMFDVPTPSLGSGAFGPLHALGVAALGGLAWRRRRAERDEAAQR